MHIVIAGSTGLIGQALVYELQSRGHRVTRLVRPDTGFKAPMGTYSTWQPGAGRIDADLFRGVDAVINLCGENIASGWWTSKKKKRLLTSRTDATATLAGALAGLVEPPRIWLNASATGFYGDRGDELLDETAPSGSGFFAEICRRWEAAAQPAIDAGVNTAFMRLGMVLSQRGGALGKMLPIFRMGLGGRLGDGQQYWPWISMPDVIGGMLHLLDLPEASGPYNFTAPEPVTNEQFTRELGRALRRPTVLGVPEQFLNILTGEMAQHVLFSSQRVAPHRLLESGYRFEHPTLAQALGAVLD